MANNLDLNTAYNPVMANPATTPVMANPATTPGANQASTAPLPLLTPYGDPGAKRPEISLAAPFDLGKAWASFAGSANSMLLGMPGAIGQSIGLKPKDIGINTDDKATREHLEQGATMGEIGSMFIPGEKLLGAALKGAGGLADVGLGLIGKSSRSLGQEALARLSGESAPNILTRAGSAISTPGKTPGFVGALSRAGKMGAGQGTLEAIRNATGESDSGIGGIAGQTALGGAFGLGGEAIGAGIKSLKNLPRSLGNVGSDFTRDWIAQRFGANPKNFKAAVINSGLASEDTFDKMFKNTANILKKYGVNTKNGVRDLLEKAGNIFNESGKAYDNTGGMGIDDLFDRITSTPEVMDYLKANGTKANKNVLSLLDSLEGSPAYDSQRAILSDWWKAKSSATAGKVADNAMAPVITKIKQIIDDEAFNRLPDEIKMQLGGKTIADAKEIWGGLTPIRKALAAGALRPENLGIGSDTFTNFALFSGLIPGGAGTGAAAAILGKYAQKGLNKLGNAAMGSFKEALSSPLLKASGSPIAANIADSSIVKKLSGSGADYARLGLASIKAAESNNNNTVAPIEENPFAAHPATSQNPAATAMPGAPVEQHATANAMLENGISQKWREYSQGYWGAADISNPMYAKFRDGAIKKMSNPVTGALDLHKAAKAMFLDPDERQLFLEGLDAVSTVQNTGDLSRAVGGPFGIPGVNAATSPLPLIGDASATGSRNQIIEAMRSIGGQSAANELSMQLDRATNSSPTNIANIFLNALAKNAQGKRVIEMLNQAGVGIQ